MTDMFFYFSHEKEGGWLASPAGMRTQVIDNQAPKYVTVLDLNALVPDEPDPDELLKIKYSGPFYADWDCEDLMDGAAAVNRFIDELAALGANPRSISIYATGGRGYHVEVPFETFSNSRERALQYLPAIYLEMANHLYTEDMDLKVYSAKRGRMWRTPNVQREQKEGQPARYKVPISLDQMRSMTPDLYDEVTRSPQPYPDLEPAILVAPLAAKFIHFKKEIEQRYRERKNRKRDDTTVSRMNGKWPASVQMLMDGKNISPNVGLNKIALQLGILSAALGKSEKEHVEACEGLIREYRGDGHSTLSAVRKEIKRMYRYAAENACYSYSPAAMNAIMESSAGVADLNGPAGPAANSDSESFIDLAQGMLNGSNGLYSAHADRGTHRECNWHFDPSTVSEIVDAQSLMTKGYTMMGKREGQVNGEVLLDHGTFTTVERTKNFLATKGGVAPRLDSGKAGGIMALIMDSARSNNQIHVLEKEGFMLLERANEEPEIVWSSPSGCLSYAAKYTYRFRAMSGSEAGNFQSDVAAAKPIKDYDQKLMTKVVTALFNWNENLHTVAVLLGWIMACWHKPMYLKWGEQFPIMQLHGESGAGKTALAQQLLYIFYYRNKPRMIQAVGGTAYGRRMMMSASTTIPLLIDEFKPHQMGAEQARAFRYDLHKLYTPQMQAPRGGGDARSAMPGQWGELVHETLTTPVMYTTEYPETETAIQERVLSAAFSKAGRGTTDAEEAFDTLRSNKEVLASLGRLVLNATAQAPLDRIKTLFDRSQELAKERLARSGNDRVVYNVGCAVSGLGFFEMVIKHEMPQAYSATFREAFETLRETLLDPKNQEALQAEPELFKLLRQLILISHTEDEESDMVCREGQEFFYTSGERDLDINVDAMYLRYRTASQRRGMTVKYQDVDAFYLSLKNSNAMMELDPPDSKFNAIVYKARVVRLDSKFLDTYGLSEFKTKPSGKKR